MGAYYDFYAEVKIGNVWHSINPIVTRIDGTTRTVPVMSGQSTLFDLYSMLCDYGYLCVPDDLSEEVQRLLCNGNLLDDAVRDGDSFVPAKDYYCVEQNVWVCNFDKVVKHKLVPGRRYRNEGYVLRDTAMAIQCREVGTDDEVAFLTQKEYDKLDKTEQTSYVWYEWNYPWDVYGQLSNLNERISNLISWFSETFYDHDMNSTVSYKDSQNIETRVITTASW